jgi:DnaK suppressor protein
MNNDDEADRDHRRAERFRPRLQDELRELLDLREQTSQSRDPVELDQQSIGRLSRMDALQGQQMALAAERRRQVRVTRIHQALRRMEEGEYGCCVTCGEEIPDRRLEADPAAHQCVACAA